MRGPIYLLILNLLVPVVGVLLTLTLLIFALRRAYVCAGPHGRQARAWRRQFNADVRAL